MDTSCRPAGNNTVAQEAGRRLIAVSAGLGAGSRSHLGGQVRFESAKTD